MAQVNSLFKKIPFFNNEEDLSENNIERNPMSPRNSKHITIGNPSAGHVEENSTHIEDMSATACIVGDIVLSEDTGKQMLHTINRLKNGQLIIADFSSAADAQAKRDQFNVLWGAVMALDGHFRKLNDNFYVFSSDANQIAVENSATRSMKNAK